MSHEKKNKEGYSSLQDFIQAEILQHCQCGRPEDSLEFIKKLLNHLNKRIHPDQYGTYEKYSDSFAAWGKELN